MREPKQRKTKLIHMLKNTWKTTQRGKAIQNSEQAEIIIAIDCSLIFLEIFDGLRNEIHKTYFIKLFLSSINNMTQAQLSSFYKICRDTVSDYNGMYIGIFEKYLTFIKELEIDFDKSGKEGEIIKLLTKKAVQNRKE